MPTISLFFGITIKMFKEAYGKHNMPHFHAEYGEYEAAIDFDGNVIEGELPRGKLKLVVAWTEIHREDLEANWTLLSQGHEFFRIDPLR